MQNATDSDLDIQLLNSNGGVIAFSQTAGNVIEQIQRTNLLPGTYIIRIVSTQVRTLGNYDLNVTVSPASDDTILAASVLTLPDPLTRPLITRTDFVDSTTDIQDYYSLTLPTDSPLRIELTGMSSDVDLELLNSQGVVLDSRRNAGVAVEYLTLASLPAGAYYLRVYAKLGASSIYNLSVVADAASDDLLSSASVLGTLTIDTPTFNRFGDVFAVRDDRDYYKITLAQVSSLRLDISGLSADADIFLEDAFGRAITNSAKVPRCLRASLYRTWQPEIITYASSVWPHRPTTS